MATYRASDLNPLAAQMLLTAQAQAAMQQQQNAQAPSPPKVTLLYFILIS